MAAQAKRAGSGANCATSGRITDRARFVTLGSPAGHGRNTRARPSVAVRAPASGRPGQLHGEGAAGALGALDGQLAVVAVDQLLGDGQAEAGAAGLAVSGLVAAVEAFEDAFQL